ncbi:DUF4337 domain-containing protein [Ideonella sp.]|uniref:DUF4337 domain-containing protein n=1 Tax=Ideonella sp. TaxID=1929293 RepID=UPI002B495C1C|nr:DUF4337 domain-containing protein [Ideonella sp.]HJV70083.1 DUF4337 domain-containing protein [Ideonella sp.]
MDIDPREIISTDDVEKADRSSARLNTLVAITVSVLATFMGICKVKDDNIVQAMQQAQADKLDHWNFYQARNIRQDVAEASALQLRLAKAAAPAQQAAAYDDAIAKNDAKAAGEAQKKRELQLQAANDQTTYDRLNYRDDQFDLSDAALAIAIALLAVTALTKLWWMYWVSWVPISFGVLMGLSGLFGWAVHPDTLSRLLS